MRKAPTLPNTHVHTNTYMHTHIRSLTITREIRCQGRKFCLRHYLLQAMFVQARSVGENRWCVWQVCSTPGMLSLPESRQSRHVSWPQSLNLNRLQTPFWRLRLLTLRAAAKPSIRRNIALEHVHFCPWKYSPVIWILSKGRPNFSAMNAVLFWTGDIISRTSLQQWLGNCDSHMAAAVSRK